MISRILPPSEWHKLEVTGMSQIGPVMKPEDVQVVVVEDRGQIVAAMSVLKIVHFETLWIDPSKRGNAGLGRRLIKAGSDAAKKLGSSWTWACCDTAKMSNILKRLGGVKLPVESFILSLGGH